MRGDFPWFVRSGDSVGQCGLNDPASVLRILCWGLLFAAGIGRGIAQPLPGTAELTGDSDRAAEMVQGIQRYLDRATAETVRQRVALWTPPEAPADTNARAHFLASNRVHLRRVLGLGDSRDVRPRVTLHPVAPLKSSAPPDNGELARGAHFRAYAVAWTALRGVEGEGLLLLPDDAPRGDVVAVPDSDWTPEQFAGLAPGLPPGQQLARLCAESGCRVLVPALIGRGSQFVASPGLPASKHSQRETLWRAGYEMGRTPVAYELQKIFAAADWMGSTRTANAAVQRLGIVGYGEGGFLALNAAAVDTRFAAAWVSGSFGPREDLWKEPIDRNLFGILREFGDAEVAALVAPRALFLEYGRYPELTLTDQDGGSPGRLTRPDAAAVTAEYQRFQRLAGTAAGPLIVADAGEIGNSFGQFMTALTGRNEGAVIVPGPDPVLKGELPDPGERALRQYRQMLEDTQWLMRDGEYARRDFWKQADFKSLAAFTNSAARYRDYFRSNVLGIIPPASVPPNVRTRLLGETNGVKRYEVLLDVHPDITAYGILCIPADLKAGERRPVVVCQHGLEGRPTDVSDPAISSPYYHQYGLRLAERGFITFAPQNPYIGGTKFRQVLHQAQPLGLTLWSFMVRQHEAITDWLATQPFVDPQRIAFYGLSYGGKTAMRVPVLVDRYCLSICSADYNEWIWKNVSARSPYSYLWTSEYDMPEWNLGNTFNYAELSWLILPRPFMVERGHDDGVAPDEWVAYEYAKTRRNYVKLGLADRTEIEFFDGPHSIHGVGTFDFLHRHLHWPKPR